MQAYGTHTVPGRSRAADALASWWGVYRRTEWFTLRVAAAPVLIGEDASAERAEMVSACNP